MKVYLAGPISGSSYHDVQTRLVLTGNRLKKMGWTVMDPMTGKGHLRTETKFREHGYEHPISTNHAIVERDRWMVKQSDVVLADLRNAERVSIGTMMELAWAHDNSVHTIVVMEKVNVHRHAFVLEAADIIYEDFEEAIKYLGDLAKSFGLEKQNA